jgi:hypothetical protein
MDIQIIGEDELSFVPRGRKTTVSPELVKALASLPKGKAARLVSLTVAPNDPDAKAAKARVGAQIRAAAKAAGVKVGILWSPDGVPQVVRK